MNKQADVLYRLMAVVQDRKKNPPKRSYTTYLMRGGMEKIGEKILEEANELIEAAGKYGPGHDENERTHLIHEAADLVYHLLVLLAYHDLELTDVESELARRFGVSGLDEKESRTNDSH